MGIWLTLIVVVHVLSALGVIGLVLLQHGKGADVGAAFGGGASGSLFGATGSANFLSRATAIIAVVFFLSSLGLAYLANVKPKTGGSVMDRSGPPATETSAPPAATGKPPAPAVPGSKADDVPK